MATELFSSVLKPLYVPQRRAERLIAFCRFLLAAFSLIAVWYDPATPARFQAFTYTLLAFYVVYSTVLLALTWRMRRLPTRSWVVTTHVIDLLLFSLFNYLTAGPASPFFVYFVFSMFCAMLRFPARGILATAGFALAVYSAMGVYAGLLLDDPAFELNRFIIRSVYLAVTAAMLIYFGYYQERLQFEIAAIASWPRGSDRLDELLGDATRRLAAVLATPRVLLLWEEGEEPWINVAYWDGESFSTRREPPGRYGSAVDESLDGLSFFTVQQAAEVMIHGERGGTLSWNGPVLSRRLVDDFAITDFLSVPLEGERMTGRLFALDRVEITTDEMILAGILSRLITASLDELFLREEVRVAGGVEERLRLSRDLHDGVLQSLTGIALQLQALRAGVASRPDELERLTAIQTAIEDDQRDLRDMIRGLRPSAGGTREGFSLEDRLETLRDRFRAEWGMTVTFEALLDRTPPPEFGMQIFRIVNEALANAARHGRATSGTVRIFRSDEMVEIDVADNGTGFPFHGRFDLATLNAMQRGPRSLKERIAALGGSLVVESRSDGARIEARLPMPIKETLHAH